MTKLFAGDCPTARAAQAARNKAQIASELLVGRFICHSSAAGSAAIAFAHREWIDFTAQCFDFVHYLSRCALGYSFAGACRRPFHCPPWPSQYRAAERQVA